MDNTLRLTKREKLILEDRMWDKFTNFKIGDPTKTYPVKIQGVLYRLVYWYDSVTDMVTVDVFEGDVSFDASEPKRHRLLSISGQKHTQTLRYSKWIAYGLFGIIMTAIISVIIYILKLYDSIT